ncbi:hypothetical protein [Streptomyces purpureus]|uniref:Uncharacterized protein n=1 Tax=Streptomyces purpureus TaxID=1951 RepID=A0A918LMK4_9ACTN|nr:hypothetical protein [Streptomyces purpureus]GGT19790.1 hypothetical protein GCM10014713_11030 [Streptomyces purpureus]
MTNGCLTVPRCVGITVQAAGTGNGAKVQIYSCWVAATSAGPAPDLTQ